MKNCPNCQSEVPNEFDICWKCNYDFQAKKVLQPQTESEAEKEPYQVKILKCLRCESSMKFVGEKKFHEGKRHGVWGEIGELMVKRTVINMYECTNCGKVEFFT
jgi:hypothetical protein